MKPLIQRVILHSDSDVEYPFQGDPYIPTQTANVYNIAVDPFPGYAPDYDRVCDEVRHVESRFPLGINVFYHCMRHEMIYRSNGAADLTGNEGWVALSGKRIPIHPAITRSLVAHEYGHIVFRMIHRRAGQDFFNQYLSIRQIDYFDSLRPRSWHMNFEEIAVNDFRILMCDRESEYWPHNCPHPTEVAELKPFWRKLRKVHGG
jgi:hypothetical protein